MTDIATLGLAIDSRQAVAAKTALEGLAAAARPAEAATKGLEASAAKAGTTLGTTAKQAQTAGAAVKSTNGSLTNLSFQINDIATGLASGQSPFQVLAQQGGQVFQVWQMNNQVFSQAKNAVLGFLTPTRVLGIAGAALAVAGIAVGASWKTAALQLDDTSRAVNTTLGDLRAIQSLAAGQNIVDDDFFKSIEKFGQVVYDARLGTNGLSQLFRANGAAVTDFNSTLERTAELIKNAGNDQQRLDLLGQAGLPANMQWVRLMSQGAAGIRAARDAGSQMSATERDMIDGARRFDAEWNKAINSLTNGMKSGFVGLVGWLDRVSDYATNLMIKFDKFTGGSGQSIPLNLLKGAYNGTVSGTRLGANSSVDDFYRGIGGVGKGGSGTVDKDTLLSNNNRLISTISLLGQFATASEIVKAKEAELQNAWLSGNVTLGKRKQAVLDLVQLQYEQSRASQAAQFGIFNPDQYARIEQLQLSTLINDGTIKNAQDYGAAVAVITKNIREASDAAAVARSPFEQMTRYSLDAANLTKQIDQVGTNALSGLETGMASVITRTKSLKDAFKDMANSIISDLVRMTIRSTITGPLSGALTGLFNGLGGGVSTGTPGGTAGNLPPLHHSGYGPGDPITARRFVDPSAFSGAPRMHTGVGPGERAAIIRNDESVLTPGQMKALGRMTSGGQAVTNVFIENKSGATATTTRERNATGGTDIHVLINSTVNKGMTNGEYDNSLRNRAGTRPPKVI